MHHSYLKNNTHMFAVYKGQLMPPHHALGYTCICQYPCKQNFMNNSEKTQYIAPHT